MEQYKDTAPLYPTAPGQQVMYAPGVPVIQAPQQPQIVVVQQPVAVGVAPVGKHGVPMDEYQIGLCNCCAHPLNCLIAYCCPCYLGCMAADKLGENKCFSCCFGIYPLNIRFRTLVGIKQTMCDEACTFCWCPCCAALRLVNEMDERNFEMHRC